MIPVISAPDWLTRPIRPGGGATAAKLALSAAAGRNTPRQLGPMRRMPTSRAISTIWPCSASPSSPISANPALMMMAARTPTAAASVSNAGMKRGGIATTMSSTGEPTEARSLATGWPRNLTAFGIHGEHFARKWWPRFVTPQEVAQRRVAYGIGAGGGTDHGDRCWREKWG